MLPFIVKQRRESGIEIFLNSTRPDKLRSNEPRNRNFRVRFKFDFTSLYSFHLFCQISYKKNNQQWKS
jgi:hypothetical protein